MSEAYNKKYVFPIHVTFLSWVNEEGGSGGKVFFSLWLSRNLTRIQAFWTSQSQRERKLGKHSFKQLNVLGCWPWTEMCCFCWQLHMPNCMAPPNHEGRTKYNSTMCPERRRNNTCLEKSTNVYHTKFSIQSFLFQFVKLFYVYVCMCMGQEDVLYTHM